MNYTPARPGIADAGTPRPALVDDCFIKSRIHTIRGVQVMLSPDLADLYQVETRAFNQAVKRNEERFPPSFRFQLTKEELREVITNCDNPDRLRFSPQTPYAFTEQGVAMLSGILNSAVAIRVSIRIMETFVAMRKALASIAPVMARLAEAERRQLEDRTRQIADQTRNEERFDVIFKAMDGGDFPPQKVFYDGQVYDAFEQMKKFVRIWRRFEDPATRPRGGVRRFSLRSALRSFGDRCATFRPEVLLS